MYTDKIVLKVKLKYHGTFGPQIEIYHILGGLSTKAPFDWPD